MWFKITAGGTDYVQLSIDVHKDQLSEVICELTGLRADAPKTTPGEFAAARREAAFSGPTLTVGNRAFSSFVENPRSPGSPRGEVERDLTGVHERLLHHAPQFDHLSGELGITVFVLHGDERRRRDLGEGVEAAVGGDAHAGSLPGSETIDDDFPQDVEELAGTGVSGASNGTVVDEDPGHGCCSSCGYRCAGAARACGAGDTEATEPPLTKEERWLWAAQELGAMLSALLETGPEAYEDTEGVELGGPDCGDGAEGPEGGDA